MLKILGGGCAILTVLLVIAGMHIKNLNMSIDIFETQVRDLTVAVEKANEATEKMTAFAESDRTRAAKYEQDLTELREINTAFLVENMQLRSTENDQALQNPFRRGLAAGGRLRSLWLRVETNPYSDTKYLDTAPANDTQD